MLRDGRRDLSKEPEQIIGGCILHPKNIMANTPLPRKPKTFLQKASEKLKQTESYNEAIQNAFKHPDRIIVPGEPRKLQNVKNPQIIHNGPPTVNEIIANEEHNTALVPPKIIKGQ